MSSTKVSVSLIVPCKNEETNEEFIIEPSYPKGKPKELQGLEIIPGFPA